MSHNIAQSNTLAELEHVLGESLDKLSDAARLIRAAERLDSTVNLKKLGSAIHDIWQIREAIYVLEPAVKPDLVSEYEADTERFNRLNALYDTAVQYEQQGNVVKATAVFHQLLQSTDSGFFVRHAQAGLYRLSLIK